MKAMNSSAISGSSLMILCARGLRNPATAPENIIMNIARQSGWNALTLIVAPQS